MTETAVEEQVKEKTKQVITNDLIIYNDDYNSFDHVINSLVKICKHESIQAEQCTHIIHNNGKCAVKKGELKTLKPMRDALCERGIDAKIH
jgi:ATP-dependent Clp protease adaptor protein ClpS